MRRSAVTFLLLALVCSPSVAEPFRLVVMPDTQFAVQKWPELVDSMTRWIAENHQAQQIKYVLHVGDMVQNGHEQTEWQRFDVSMRTLERAEVPYILAAGNHDFDQLQPQRSLDSLNKYFPVTRFEKRPTFGGCFPNGTNNNCFHTFSAGGIDWLIVSLTYHPTADELQWAGDVIGRHAQRQAIVLTHDYLGRNGRSAAGEQIWEQLVQPHANVLLVVCGHSKTVHQVDESVDGRRVYQMLFDWQNEKQPENNSYLAIIELNPEQNSIAVNSYSPALQKNKTDELAKFSFQDVHFLQAQKLATTADAAQQPAYLPTEKYLARQVQGWPVLVHPELAQQSDLHERTLEVLRMQLLNIKRRLAPNVVLKLQGIPIWIELESGRCDGAQYHAIGTPWLAEQGMNPAKAGAVEICHARHFIDWTLAQPWMMLHELAHGLHDRLPDRYENKEILAAYQQARDANKYQSVRRSNGRMVRAYALNNQMEYFAETTEAFFGANDYFPFVRGELKAHDPLMFTVLKRVWGHSDADNYLWQAASLPKTSPWNLTELAKVPNFQWQDHDSPVRTLLYEGEPFRGRTTRVFACYATPGTLAGDATLDVCLPGVVLVHGGGGTAYRDWVTLWASRGYAAIAMDLAGSKPDGSRLPRGGPDQTIDMKFGDVDQPVQDQWPYHAVANVIRAHSLLRSFAEVDESHTGLTGISWGGYVTNLVAALDRRFAAAVAVYGCGFLHEGSAWLANFEQMNDQSRDKWVSLWDPSRYVASTEIPLLLVSGTNDKFFWLDSLDRTYRLIKPEHRHLRVTAGMPHSHQAGIFPREIEMFIDQYGRGTLPLPVIAPPRLIEGQIEAAVTAPIELASAAIHFSKSTGSPIDRVWQSESAVLDDQAIRVASPTDATAWFLTVTDQRGATVSSEVVFVPPSDGVGTAAPMPAEP